MDELLIKVRLNIKADHELLKHFASVPKGRRAEQMRRLALDGLRYSSGNFNTNLSSQTSTVATLETANLNDDELFANDMNSLNNI